MQAISTGRAPHTGRGYRIRRALAATRLPLPARFGLGTPFARPARSAVTLVAVLLGATTVVFAAGLATSLNRVAAGVMFAGGVVCMSGAYGFEHNHVEMYFWLPVAHFFIQGIFGLFPLYIPPLFPTLLRTTGAGFCYNIGRTAAAFGTVFFGLFSKVGDHRAALFYAGFLFLPANGQECRQHFTGSLRIQARTGFVG